MLRKFVQRMLGKWSEAGDGAAHAAELEAALKEVQDIIAKV